MREQDYPTGSDFSSSAIIRKLRFWIEQSERQNLLGIFFLTSDRTSGHSLVERRGKYMPQPTDLLQGTLDLLILRTLLLEPMHGWGIAQRIQQSSQNTFQIGQGSLYPALHRLEYKGWIQADWKASENNRKAKYYALTRTGKKQLEAEIESWGRLAGAIALVLEQG